jgi:hypothetical protein
MATNEKISEKYKAWAYDVYMLDPMAHVNF